MHCQIWPTFDNSPRRLRAQAHGQPGMEETGMSGRIDFYLSNVTGISSYLSDLCQDAADYEKALIELSMALPYSIDEICPRFKKLVQTSLYDWRTCKALLLHGDVELPPL